MVKAKDFKRKTHNEYTFMSEAAKKVGILNKLDKEITHDVKKITKEAIAIEKNNILPISMINIWNTRLLISKKKELVGDEDYEGTHKMLKLPYSILLPVTA